MEAVSINWLAVIAASLVGFAIGFIWYGPLFGKSWMEAVGLSEEEVQNSNMAKTFGFTLVFQFIMAYCLAMFFGNEVGLQEGSFYGFLTGFGWVAMAIGVNALYEQKSWKYIFINGGFWIVVFTLMGLILGAWK
ncbi:DUF1761 domain-containing protein [Gracilimonas tropica]|uniref:DUF1761 domain-containing protein n=1 Tax=Gracilimonas tropica TaxID=454600 RepID=UPI000379308A|nr:DUF1761 domain-containing protein [Gracilimonas tropica]